MFMFLLYVIILYIGSIGFSSLIKDKFKINNLKNILGFCIMLMILQIGYYPMQYFQLSSIFVNIWTFIVLLIGLIMGIKNIKILDFDFIKRYEFWLIFIIVFFIIKIIPGMEAGDDIFYMSLFIDNSSIDKINSIDPRTGIVGNIDNVYLYQGYYLLMSFFYRVQNTLFNNNINNIFISFRTTMSLLSIIFSSQIFVYLKNKYLKNKPLILIAIVQILSFFLIAVLEWCHIYWGSFMLFQIYVPLFMILFNNYLNDNKYKYLLFIVNFAAISLASSTLFLFMIISFSYFTYELFNNKACCENYYFILFPSFIYISFLFNILWINIPIILIYILLKKYKNILNRVFNKYLKYLIIILPIIFCLLSFTGNYIHSLETYRVSKITILYNLFIVCYVIYLKIINQKIPSVLFVTAIVSIFFFNPLVRPFVSHNFTSTYVYYRLFYITKNPLVVTILFLNIYDQLIKYKIKLFVPCYYILLICLIINYGYHFCKDTILLDNYNIKYNYILREDIYSMQLGKQLKELPPASKIFSVYFAPRIYNKDLITIVARYPHDYSWYKDIMVRTLYREVITKQEYYWFNGEVKEKEYDYLITYNDPKQLKNLRESDYEIIYKNSMFVLSKVIKNNN